jgi:hypothetical protein
MFKKLLSPTQRQKLNTKTEKINALFAMPDAELGEQLIELSKAAWQDVENQFSTDFDHLRSHRNSYLGGFLHDLIPEIAARLGYEDSGSHVSTTHDIRSRLQSSTQHDFRCMAGSIIANTPDSALTYNNTDTPTALEILTNDIANGNPVAFAVDRLVKPLEPVVKEDVLAWYIKEISVVRGFAEQYCWNPGMQNHQDVLVEADDQPSESPRP